MLSSNMIDIYEMDDQLKSFAKMMEPVGLHPNLVKHIYAHDRLGQILHSKFVIEPMYNPAFNGRINALYEQKLSTYRVAVKNNNWHQRIWLCERPYRVEELRKITRHGTGIKKDPAEWNKLLSELVVSVWTDTEDPAAQSKAWSQIFSHLNFKGIPHVTDNLVWMRKNVFGKVAPVRVYRGYNEGGMANGWSWTTDGDKALWFAKRYNKPNAKVVRAWMPADKILGYILARGEKEVVARPRSARIYDQISAVAFERMTKLQRRNF